MTTKVIESAIDYLMQGGEKPKPAEVVTALLAAERQSKKAKAQYDYGQLLGSWRLGFVSGTREVRWRSPSEGRSRPNSRPVKKPGTGRFLPGLAKIEITYTATNTVKNAVSVGPLQLQLTGPTKFWPNTNSLAFDFTHLKAGVGPLTVYNGGVRGGSERNQIFEAQSLKEQAFFTFFIVKEDFIAARGKGGGLALWTNSKVISSVV